MLNNDIVRLWDLSELVNARSFAPSFTIVDGSFPPVNLRRSLEWGQREAHFADTAGARIGAREARGEAF